MNRKNIFILIFIIFNYSGANIFSQDTKLQEEIQTEEENEEKPNEMEELLLEDLNIYDLMNREVISASKKSQKLKKAPANIIVIDRETIKNRGYRHITDLLREIPGFDITIGQPSGEYPSHIIFRGISDVGQTKLLILVNGVEQNDVSNGWSENMGFDFLFIDIERIEIISGPGSAVYGSEAYGGVINIITRAKNEVFQKDSSLALETNVYYGMHNTVTPEILLGYKTESGLGVWTAARWYYSEGDSGLNRADPGNYFHNNYEPDLVDTTTATGVDNKNSDGSRKKLPDGFKNNINDIYIRTHIEKDTFKIGFNYWRRNEGLGSEVPGYEYFANTKDLPFNVLHEGYTLYNLYRHDINNKLSWNSKIFHRSARILPQTEFVYTYKYQSAGSEPDKSKNYHGEGFTTGVEQQLNWNLLSNNELTVGLRTERKIEQYFAAALGVTQDTSSNIVESTFEDESYSVQPVYYINEYAVFLQDEHFFSDVHSFTTGIRYDYNSEYGYSINPRIGLTGGMGEWFLFKVLYGEAFKAPSVFELYDEFRGNEELKPEKIRTAEIELSYLIGEKGIIKTNIFHSRVENLIVVAKNQDTSAPANKTDIYQNIGKTNLTGSSLAFELHMFKHFLLYGHYVYTMGKDLKTEIDNIAKHKAFLGFNYLLFNKININFAGHWIGPIKAPETNKYFYEKDSSFVAANYDYMTEENPDGYLDGYTLFNLTLTGKNLFGSRVKLEPHLIIKNIFNNKFITPGRQSGSGVRPVDSLQPTIQNPEGFIPAYHPQPGIEILFGIRYAL
ncbi:MAG: TonB-dependent receptor [Spirochaetia bacterium]|nr:TonB-dependent receptor [Spirochaetia bacterium]